MYPDLHLFCILLPIHCYDKANFVGKSLFSFKYNRRGLDWCHVVFDVSDTTQLLSLCIMQANYK